MLETLTFNQFVNLALQSVVKNVEPSTVTLKPSVKLVV